MDFQFSAGSIPLLVSMPHVGKAIPPDIAARMTPEALRIADTDWHLELLYGFATAMGASTLAAHWSRYVIDLNRPPENTNLYPGQDTTGLCPVDTFHRAPLYLPGRQPDDIEIKQRLQDYWQPYHNQLRAELDRLVALHGRVILWEAHSIASHVPRFFDGKLPDLNFGTATGASCDVAMQAAVVGAAQGQGDYTVAVNGRFKGGYITRNYGAPPAGVHAIQLEMCQCLYMNEAAPFDYLPERAARIEPALRGMLDTALAWAENRASK